VATKKKKTLSVRWYTILHFLSITTLCYLYQRQINTVVIAKYLGGRCYIDDIVLYLQWVAMLILNKN